MKKNKKDLTPKEIQVERDKERQRRKKKLDRHEKLLAYFDDNPYNG